MQDSLYRFSLDIHSTQSQVSIPVPQFDTARGICATLTEAGKPYQISDGCHAVFSATKADGTMILNDCIIVNSSIIRYDFTEQTTAAVGIVDCSITIYGKNNKVLTSPRFTIVVYEGTRPNDVESKDEKNAIDNLFVTELNRIEAEEHRIAAETARSVAEQDRVNAELMRTAAELGRANSELTRSSAEQNRVNSESVRVEAERNRLNSESIRVEAEWKRVATELARDEAERKRAEAERQRNEVVLIDLVNAAIEEGKKTGVFGKSAYDFAKDGGYSGTAAEFAEKLAFLMGYSVVGTFDSDNNLILRGYIAEGAYTLKYENVEGAYTGTGKLEVTEVTPEPTYTNFADPTSEDWLTDCRLSFSGSSLTTKPLTGAIVTNFITGIQVNDIVKVEGINFTESNNRQALLKVDGTVVAVVNADTLSGYSTHIGSVSYDNNTLQFTVVDTIDVKKLRFSGMPTGTAQDVKITITRNGKVL